MPGVRRRRKLGRAVRRAAEEGEPGPADELPVLRLHRPQAERPLSRTGSLRARDQRGGRARAHPGHGPSRPAPAPARVLRQPAGRGVPGRVDEGPRAAFPVAGADGRGHQADAAVGRRSGELPGRSAGGRRDAVARAGPRGLAGRPAGGQRRTPPAGAPQVPAHPGGA